MDWKLSVLLFLALVTNTKTTKPGCNAPWCDPSHEPYPNIVSVMTGYHMLKGNPFTAGHTQDPGFGTSYILVPTYKTNQDRYALQGGVTVRKVRGCSLSFHTDIISTVEGYKTKIGEKMSKGASFASNLEKEVAVNIKGVEVKKTIPPIVEAAFSSSKQYKDNEKFFTSKQGILTMNDATCSTYTVDISRYDPPPFTQGFVNAVKKLATAATADNTVKKREFDLFIEQFGTHYIKQATMGARISISRKYTRNEYQKGKISDFGKCAKERLAVNFGPSLNYNQRRCKAISTSASSATVKGFRREYTTTIGSKPYKDLYKWSQQNFDAPSPIKMKLSPILNLFTKSHMKRYNINYKSILQWVYPYYINLCKSHKQQYKIDSCNPKHHRGCGWNDNCVPKIQHCINSRYARNGYICCTPKCKSLPCKNGGTCTDISSSCGYKCRCRHTYGGRNCGDRYVSGSVIKGEIKRHMSLHRNQKHGQYVTSLLRHLESLYPRYYFTVTVYNQVAGWGAHTVGGNCAVLFRTHGRNVVACWARKNSYVPSASKLTSIRNKVNSLIRMKDCHAKNNYNRANGVIRSFRYPTTMVMVVPHGSGFNAKWSHGARVLYLDFDCRRHCAWWKCRNLKSTLVAMFGRS